MPTLAKLDAVVCFAHAGNTQLVAVLAGVLNGAIVQLLGINAFIVTLGTLTAIRGIVLIVMDGRSLSVDNVDAIAAMRVFESGRVPLGHFFVLLGVVLIVASVLLSMRAKRSGGTLGSKAPAALGMLIGGGRLAVAKPVVYMAVFTGIVWFVLTFTNTGRRLYAVGGNAEAARLSGINVGRYKMAGFILCSAAAGFGGILFGSPARRELSGRDRRHGRRDRRRDLHRGRVSSSRAYTHLRDFAMPRTKDSADSASIALDADDEPMQNSKPNNYSVPAVEKALDIIEYLAAEGVPMTRAQLARSIASRPNCSTC